MSYKPSGDLVTVDGRTSQYTASGFTESFVVHLDTGSVAAETAFMLIDLSDTTNWPHTETGHIHVSYIILMVSPDASFLGDVRFGVLSSVDATNGDFHDFLNYDFSKKSDMQAASVIFGSNGLHLEGANYFGPVATDSTLFQTDVNLAGPDGTTAYPSGDGDLVMKIGRTAGTVSVSVTIGYETLA